MTTATTPADLAITIRPAASPNAYTRETRYASKTGDEGIAAIDLKIYRDGGAVKVSWSVNRGAGWGKRWTTARASEAHAVAFADEKWPTLLAWIEKVTPVASGGAAAAFSAQVASMR